MIRVLQGTSCFAIAQTPVLPSGFTFADFTALVGINWSQFDMLILTFPPTVNRLIVLARAPQHPPCVNFIAALDTTYGVFGCASYFIWTEQVPTRRNVLQFDSGAFGQTIDESIEFNNSLTFSRLR